MSANGQRRPASRPAHWGWHPLTDTWAGRVVDASPVGAGDLVLDLGAGTGALTRPLLAAGARVIALELHDGRLRELRELATHEAGLTVVRADVRDVLLPRRPFRVVSSPPYDGSSAVLDRLLAPGSRLLSADLVVQKQLARRFVEGRAKGARRWARTFRLDIAMPVPRTGFRHPPRVDSVVLRVRRAAPQQVRKIRP